MTVLEVIALAHCVGHLIASLMFAMSEDNDFDGLMSVVVALFFGLFWWVFLGGWAFFWVSRKVATRG